MSEIGLLSKHGGYRKLRTFQCTELVYTETEAPGFERSFSRCRRNGQGLASLAFSLTRPTGQTCRTCPASRAGLTRLTRCA